MIVPEPFIPYVRRYRAGNTYQLGFAEQDAIDRTVRGLVETAGGIDMIWHRERDIRQALADQDVVVEEAMWL